MQLHNVYIPRKTGLTSIDINNGRMRRITSDYEPGLPSEDCPIQVDFEGAIAFPGLINSHDHLDFNLYPRLAGRIYNNYVEWGHDIQKNYRQIIGKVLSVPTELRELWGIYKNLLNGFTTVVQHGHKLKNKTDIVDVLDGFRVLHSVSFEKDWKWKLNMPGHNQYPFTIHMGEGTDDRSTKEIDNFIWWNFFKKKVIGVHGVAMNPKQAAHFEALIWCPDSNFNLLNQTAPVDRLKESTNIIFGTDSTISAGWNCWEHLRIARKTGLLTDSDLFDSITTSPANVWKLNARGKIDINQQADLVIAKKKAAGYWDAFFAVDPKDILMVIRKGKIKLMDQSVFQQLTEKGKPGFFSQIKIQGEIKWVEGDVNGLMESIRRYFTGVEFPVEAIG